MSIEEVYEQHVRSLSLSDRLRLAQRIVAQAAEETTKGAAPLSSEQKPPESLGAKLRAIRAQIERTGEPLLDEEALRREVASRRGGVEAWEMPDLAHVR